jgi:multidrug resistance efflux pump
MTRKQDEKTSPTAADRVTRRGLGIDAERRANTATGEFPLVWPQLPESPEPPGAAVYVEPNAIRHEDEHDDVRDEDMLEEDVRDDEEVVTSSWQRPQSRGPEYHPPALPAAARERALPGGNPSGTFRVGSPPVPRVLPSEQESAWRPSSVPPVERSAGRQSALPARARLGGRRLWWPVATGLALGSLLALAFVRVPVRAWGVLKSPGAPDVLSAPLSGSVAKLKVAAGDRVEPGDVILELRVPELEANLQGRRAELEWARQESDGAAREQQAALARNLSTLARRRSLLEERLALKDSEAQQRKVLLDELSARSAATATAPPELLEATAAVQATHEARLGIVDALSQLDLELTDRKSAEQARERSQRARLAEAEARVLQAEAAAGLAALRAPAAGWVESLLVSPGSNVQSGAELGRLVPRAAPRSVVALVPSEAAADVSVGAEANVELSPPSQQATAVFAARVRYVSREVAPPSRVQAILGGTASGNFVQLELELLDSPEFQALESQLRSGWRALVSVPAPDRRLGGVLVNAVRQWWDFGAWG